jgi:hypothetical protein
LQDTFHARGLGSGPYRGMDIFDSNAFFQFDKQVYDRTIGDRDTRGNSV